MGITALEARELILTDLALVIERVELASVCLGEAYEQLSVDAADRLEDELFRPAQKAFGRSKRTYGQFAALHGLSTQQFETPSPGAQSQSVKDLVEKAVLAAAESERLIGDLQDSMMPIEFGDAELRSGLADSRELLAEIPPAARGFLRTLGR